MNCHPPQPLPEETAATIAQFYLDHQLSCRHIGQRLGLSTSSIQRALKRQGIPRRQPRPAITNAASQRLGLSEEDFRRAIDQAATDGFYIRSMHSHVTGH